MIEIHFILSAGKMICYGIVSTFLFQSFNPISIYLQSCGRYKGKALFLPNIRHFSCIVPPFFVRIVYRSEAGLRVDVAGQSLIHY